MKLPGEILGNERGRDNNVLSKNVMNVWMVLQNS